MVKKSIPKTAYIEILNNAEFQEAYFVPKIPSGLKEGIFEIDDLDIIKNYDIQTKVKYILDLGYFRARKTFFNYKFTEVLDDLTFVLKKYFPQIKTNQIKFKIPRPDSVSTLRKKILNCSKHVKVFRFVLLKFYKKLKSC